MSDHVEWITYKDKQILVATLSGLSSKEQVRAVEELARIILEEKKQGNLYLIDVRNSSTDSDVVSVAKKCANAMKPYVKKSAIIGVTDVKKYFLYLVNDFSNAGIKPFDIEEKAKDWLIQD